MKSHFQDARSVFTRAVDKWSRSGQNDPSRFPDFLSKNGVQLYASSKRALIMFVACRLGTPYSDTFFMEMASKTIWENGCEAGMPNFETKNCGQDSNASGLSRRKRKRSSMDYEDTIERTVGTIEQAVDALSNTAQGTTASEKPQNSALDSWNYNNSMFEILEPALLALERAEKLPGRSEFLKIAQLRYNKALSDYHKMCGISDS